MGEAEVVAVGVRYVVDEVVSEEVGEDMVAAMGVDMEEAMAQEEALEEVTEVVGVEGMLLTEDRNSKEHSWPCWS